MKFIKILHYVEKSFENKPSFVILMSDGKEYISNGCVWVPNIKEYVAELIAFYNCKEYLEELFKSAPIDMSNVINANYMFAGSNLTKFDSDMSSVTYARCMFADSKLTEFNSDMGSVTNDFAMFYNTPYQKSRLLKGN